MGRDFESWLALRRLNKAGERPNPLLLVDETTELKKELDALKAEHTATVSALKRMQAQGSAAAAAGGAPGSSSAKWVGMGAAFIGGVFTVMAVTALFSGQTTAVTEEAAPAANETEAASGFYSDPAAAPADTTTLPPAEATADAYYPPAPATP